MLQKIYITILLYFLDVGPDILRQPLELGLPGAGAVLVGVVVPLHPAAPAPLTTYISLMMEEWVCSEISIIYLMMRKMVNDITIFHELSVEWNEDNSCQLTRLIMVV